MATTDARLARVAVEDLVASGAGIAVLHGEDRLANLGVTSDVDLVADRPAPDVLHAAVERWEQSGLFPIVLWPYDVAGTGTIFLVDHDASDGVQIDVLHDVHGRGQYGFRTGAMMRHVVPGEAFPRLDEAATQVYVARKRQVKNGQGPEPAAYGPLVDELLSPSAALAFVEGDPTTRRGAWLSRATRVASRLRSPVGAWIHIAGTTESSAPAEAMQLVAARLERILPHVATGALEPLPGRISWWARSVAGVRWRPGVFVSWAFSGESRPFGCDVFTRDDGDPDSTAELIVRELRSRLVE